MGGRPLDVLEASLDEDVTVRLKDDREFIGTLEGYDQHMNIVLSDVAVVGMDETRDTTVIRGDNVVSITP